MKKIVGIIAFVMVFVTVQSAQAQFGFGVKAGLNVSKVKTDKCFLSSGNRAGFIVGPTAEFTIPVIGLGVDAALLYNNKRLNASQSEALLADGTREMSRTMSETLHYLDIPVNLKYTLGLGSKFGIYAATGPQFSFNVGKDRLFENSYRLNKSDFSWNVGAGVKLLGYLHIGYNYNIAIDKTKKVQADGTVTTVWNVVGKDVNANMHQFSVTYIF